MPPTAAMENGRHREIESGTGRDFGLRPHVVIQRNYRYRETANTLEQYVIITEDDCACYNLWNQRYTRETFKAEIESAGLTCIGFYDDVAGKPYTGKDVTICAAAQKLAPNGN